jgi:branched-chain amino acid transport system substrate-binding protein
MALMRAQSTVKALARNNLAASLPPALRILCLLLLLLMLFTFIAAAQSQPDATKPYATLDRQGVTYRGPVSAEEPDDSAGTAVIGLILPLNGSQESEGRALLAAARLAIEEEQARGPLPDGRRLKIAVRDESGPWGQASAEILKLIEEDHALAILTSANGTTAHLADQIANKISVPILTLSSDPSTTQANVPWLFRVGPSDTDQARAFCERIYGDPGLRKVLLVVETDHDGRVGAAEFEKLAEERHSTAPVRFEIADGAPNLRTFGEALQMSRPDAIVLWTDAPVAEELLSIIGTELPAVPVFLCRKGAQLNASQANIQIAPATQQVPNSDQWFSIDFAAQTPRSGSFEKLYPARTGKKPGLAAEDAYQAVRMIATAIRQTGASRTLLREYFAVEPRQSNVNQNMGFDPAGNSVGQFAIIRLGSFENIATYAATHSSNP